MPRIRITSVLPKARYGAFMQTSDGDPDEEWIRKILNYESKYGSATGGGLSNYGYNDWKKLGHSHAPGSIDEAVEYFKKDFLPKVEQYPTGLRERAADFLYNTGRDPRVYILDQYLKSKGQTGLANRGSYNIDTKTSDWTPQLEQQLNAEWNKYKNDIEKLPMHERANLLDQGRDFYYQNINRVNGKPNPAYEASWKKRLDIFPKITPPAQQTQQSQPKPLPTLISVPKTTPQTVSSEPSKPEPFITSTNTSTNPTQTIVNNNIAASTQNNPFEGEPKIKFKPSLDNSDITPPSDVFEELNKQKQDETYPPLNLNKDEVDERYKNDPAFRAKYDASLDRLKRKRAFDNTMNDIGYGITHPGQMVNKGMNWMNKKFYQGADWLNKNPTFQKAANRATDVYTKMMTVSPIITYLDNLQKQRKWNKWFTLSNLSDNLYAARPASMTGNRGDWDINTGIFRPNEIGFKSKGMYTNRFDYPAPGIGVPAAYGGSINNNANPMQKVRIRITGGPEKMATGGQPMTYSGQLGYGINLGQKRIYTDMPPDKTETINKTVQPVPRDQANIEAEKGETVFGDLDGDGALEHMVIGGKKHTEGGTPLNVPEGSFIFSDTKDLVIKDKKILEKFNMPASRKGYTPAEIAKKYDTTKYKAIIEDENADPIKKSTAQIMVKTFEKRLAELALIQEQMKGFPQGIPEVAKKYFPNLQTKEDQQRQPGASENIQYGQPQQAQGPQEEMAEGAQQEASEEEQMEPQMAYGGMIPRYDFAGQVFNINDIASGNTTPADIVVNPGPDDPEAIQQTYTPAQRAAMSDPEFARFKELMKKYDTGKYGKNAVYINALTPSEAAEFARLASKFGFRRGTEDNMPGYRIVQGATPGYSFTTGTGKNAKKVGFFGGFTPDMYEKRLIEDIYGKDASDRMTDVERRRKYFEELGVDLTGISDNQLANPKTLYQNKDFFTKKFYPAFTQTFNAGQFRPEMKDDMLIGAEHYDSYKTRPKPTDETIVGYKCTGRDAAGKANIISSSYMNKAAMDADGAVLDPTAAYAQCPEKPIQPGTMTGGKTSNVPFDYMTPDKVTMLATMLGYPKKYLPWGEKLPFEPGDVVFKDWRAKAAERQSLFNKMANQLNTYSPGASAAANLSFLAGQQAEGLSKDIDEVDAYNVQVANAFSDRERQRKDIINAANLAKAEELYKGNVIANQQYDNAKRAYYNNMAKAFGNAWKNRMYLGLLNSVNPMFNIDPWQGQSHFKGGYGPEDLGGALFGTTTGTTSTGSNYRDRVSDYLRRGYTITDARKYAAEDDRKMSFTGSLTNRQAALQGARALLSGYGGLGAGFNPDEEANYPS